MVFGCFGGLQRPQHWQANQALVKPGAWPVTAMSQATAMSKGCRIVFVFFAPGFVFFFGFLSWYHLPCICNSLELEPVILHGICYILAWSLCILHRICYIWPCRPSILYGICHILAFQPLICMVFVTFWYFKRSCGSLEGSLGFHLGCHLRFHLGFRLGFYLGIHLGFYSGFHLGFH